MLRAVVILAMLAASLAACSSGVDPAAEAAQRKIADTYAIEQIEVDWHRASSTKDVDLMMSLWADNATFTTGTATYTGKDQIRAFFADQAAPFRPENNWVSDTPAYKLKISVDGDTGTLYFECDYVDVDTREVKVVVGADQKVARIGGRWLITDFDRSLTDARRLRGIARPHTVSMPGRRRGHSPLVHAVARLPTTVQTKLLVSFAATATLLVVVGLLGLTVLRDSNDRVARLGSLQVRTTAYQELQTVATELRLLLGKRAGGSDARVYAGDDSSDAPTGASYAAIDSTISGTIVRFTPATDRTSLGFVPTPDEQPVIDEIRLDSAQLGAVMTAIIDFDKAEQPRLGVQLQEAKGEPLARSLEGLTSGLVRSTTSQTASLIADNDRSFSASQLLFIAVAVASIMFALLLGYVLSRSLVGPIRLTEARLRAIASGDFTGHVDVPNRDELGSLAGNVNGMNDELGRLYRELEAASDHKSEFLANMSHELRTPLNAVIGFSDVLSEQMYGDLNGRQLDYVNDIRTSGRDLLSLINDILDLSKVEAGQMELHLQPFSLPDALQSSLTVIRERAVRQDIELRLTSRLERPVIVADERKVKQVLFNLLSNAVKFTPSGGHVEVAASDDPLGVEVSVQDDGVGIALEDQERIFDAFQQVHRVAGSQEGTGLGLGLAKQLVELHGGQLRVASTIGVGSTFTMWLPAQPSSILA